MADVLGRERLDCDNPVPLYHQTAQALEAAIENGRLPEGTRLEGEMELAARLGISRPTMRAALRQLVDKGLLIRRRGIGTVVAPKPVRRTIALTSLYDDLDEAGREPRTRLLSLETVPCPPDISEQLDLKPSEIVARFARLRTAGETPIARMHNAVPVGVLELAAEDLERTGLYRLFREGGITPHIATQQIGAHRASTEEAEILEVEVGAPVLTMTRITYYKDGRPIEYGSHSYPAESYWFEMTLVDM